MTRLVRAELLKLRTLRLVYIVVAVTALVVMLAVVNGITGAGRGDNPALGSDSLRQAVEGIPARFFSIIVLLLAILGMAGEFHHQTATQTFLVTPRRGRVVAAKLVAYAAMGMAFAAVASVVTVAIAVPWLAAEGADVSLLDGEIGLGLLGILASTALYGVIGVALGALLRNQTAAVAAAVVWVMGIEGILLAVLETFQRGLGDDVGKWLPGLAADALARGSGAPPQLLSAWAGGLLFAVYGVALAVVGARFVVRRDVT
ncbi:MAG TPA: ABC transporter permease [Acidimicrobiales bacterium]|nr:ABC transporter permease [Acidimicrobiales bacterium]